MRDLQAVINATQNDAAMAVNGKRCAEPTLRVAGLWSRASPRVSGARRIVQAAALSPGIVGYAQGSSSSSWLWGWPPTIRVIMSAR